MLVRNGGRSCSLFREEGPDNSIRCLFGDQAFYGLNSTVISFMGVFKTDPDFAVPVAAVKLIGSQYNTEIEISGNLIVGIINGENWQDYANIINRSIRSEEHTSELQSRGHHVCRLL